MPADGLNLLNSRTIPFSPLQGSPDPSPGVWALGDEGHRRTGGSWAVCRVTEGCPCPCSDISHDLRQVWVQSSSLTWTHNDASPAPQNSCRAQGRGTGTPHQLPLLTNVPQKDPLVTQGQGRAGAAGAPGSDRVSCPQLGHTACSLTLWKTLFYFLPLHEEHSQQQQHWGQH